MVHKDISEGQKRKPRGRPFPKGNKRGKLENDILVSTGLESGNVEGVVAPNHQHVNSEPLKDETAQVELGKLVLSSINNIINNVGMDATQDKQEHEIEEDKKSLELIESLEFKNGEDTLTIRFSKKHNRMYRIQIFLNDEIEVRPVTYTGANTGCTFWKLLKGALKK